MLAGIRNSTSRLVFCALLAAQLTIVYNLFKIESPPAVRLYNALTVKTSMRPPVIPTYLVRRLRREEELTSPNFSCRVFFTVSIGKLSDFLKPISQRLININIFFYRRKGKKYEHVNVKEKCNLFSVEFCVIHNLFTKEFGLSIVSYYFRIIFGR